MKRLFKALAFLAVLILIVWIGVEVALRGRGWDARARPGKYEAALSMRLRDLAMPRDARDRANPIPASEQAVRDGLEHFADHCAQCHGNDGAGDTDFGRGLYPKPPDMRSAATQSLTDGELFYIIERGVPLTGMPGFGTGRPEGETASWHLVHFIRRIPKLTEQELAEMADLNPRSAGAWQQRMEELEFLRGGEKKPAPRPPVHKHQEN